MAGDEAQIVLQSFVNRMRTMHLLWQAAASDMSAEQVNHRERDGVLPLACSFAHFFLGEDAAVSWYLLGQEPFWRSSKWQERVNLAIPVPASIEMTGDAVPPTYPEGSAWMGIPVETMQYQRIGSWERWKEYQWEVIKQTETAMERLTVEKLIQVVVPSLPASLERTYIGRLAGGAGTPLRLLDVLEGAVYAHGLRHLGEVEYGRSLVGLGGLTV